MDAWDRGHEVDVAFLDFRKAFDTVPHKRFLQKVAYFGIQGLILTCAGPSAISTICE
ncbi:hypothetical protein CAPTEDRAFT_123827 [Capitella teleta]|uniref:Reverse transcriptase domain-containing protein n=1 Tax=Capitella teleta TaxID=283909 RepID=R7TIU8_CAPTE|nr:hypothetical protein CAPTEDRAFT_123827 [Capitella teleta]|eukprot:ELT93397.1 hypothetical protein CAPTEDRAFT_123827 [Capitella teleta]